MEPLPGRWCVCACTRNLLFVCVQAQVGKGEKAVAEKEAAPAPVAPGKKYDDRVRQLFRWV